MYELNDSYTLQEYFLWIVKNNKVNYKEIINYKNKHMQNEYFLLQLENRNLIDVYDFVLSKYKCVYITKSGMAYYLDLYPINNNQNIMDSFLTGNNLLYSNISKNKPLSFSCLLKRERESTIRRITAYLQSYDYNVERINETEILCYKLFGKYPIHFFTYYEYLQDKYNNGLFTNKNYLICTFSIKDRVRIEYDIKLWILNHYENFDAFLSDGFAYSVGTINNILNSYDYPRIIPQSTRLIYF